MKIFFIAVFSLLLIATASIAQVETVLTAHDAGYYYNFGISVTSGSFHLE